MSTTDKPVRLRRCARCGQGINTRTESWKMKTGEDGRYATGIEHVTCPASPEIRDLPTAPPSAPEAAPMPSKPDYVTRRQAARLIHVSEKTIDRRIRSGVLPALRVTGGQTVLIDRKDVLALLEPIPPGTEF